MGMRQSSGSLDGWLWMSETKDMTTTIKEFRNNKEDGAGNPPARHGGGRSLLFS